jgi:hypothetical protein
MARLVKVGDDLAVEYPDGSGSRLVYLTGNAEDRFPVTGKHREDQVSDHRGVDRLRPLEPRARGSRRQIRVGLHQVLDFLFKRSHRSPSQSP